MTKRAIFILAPTDFRDEEFLEPRQILEARNVQINVASQTRNRAIGKLGTEIEPDLALPEINPKNFDALIFVGGAGAVDYFNSLDVFKLIQDFSKAKKILSAISIAPSILANAGVLISKTVTAYPTEEENLKNRGAEYTGMAVEVDGRIITAKDTSSCKEFAEQLAYLLEE